MEDGPPVVFGGKIEGNVLAVFGASVAAVLSFTQKEAGQADGLAFVERRHLPQLLAVAVGDDLQRYGDVYVDLLEDHSKRGPHLLEAQNHVAASFLSSISHDREMW